MSNQEILEKAIQKAIDGGWQPKSSRYDIHTVGKYGYVRWRWSGMNVVPDFSTDRPWSDQDWYTVIYSHDFAKALWGDYSGVDSLPTWQYHLRQMVISDDPIKYLEENM